MSHTNIVSVTYFILIYILNIICSNISFSPISEKNICHICILIINVYKIVTQQGLSNLFQNYIYIVFSALYNYKTNIKIFTQSIIMCKIL